MTFTGENGKLVSSEVSNERGAAMRMRKNNLYAREINVGYDFSSPIKISNFAEESDALNAISLIEDTICKDKEFVWNRYRKTVFAKITLTLAFLSGVCCYLLMMLYWVNGSLFFLFPLFFTFFFFSVDLSVHHVYAKDLNKRTRLRKRMIKQLEDAIESG